MTIELQPSDVIDNAPGRRLRWGGKSIAAYLGQSEKWLRRQLERAKRPPPVFRVGSALVADLDDLDGWLNAWKEKTLKRNARAVGATRAGLENCAVLEARSM